MAKLAVIGVGGFIAAGYFGLVPQSPASVALTGAAVTVLMVWIGLFARI